MHEIRLLNMHVNILVREITCWNPEKISNKLQSAEVLRLLGNCKISSTRKTLVWKQMLFIEQKFMYSFLYERCTSICLTRNAKWMCTSLWGWVSVILQIYCWNFEHFNIQFLIFFFIWFRYFVCSKFLQTLNLK